MREIKFRAWDTELKMMVYENEQTGDTGYETNPVHAVNSIINEDYAEYIWMQYTGLKDKNGKEIYEGDIIKYNFKSLLDKEGINKDRIAQVYWQEFRGCWSVKESRYCNNELFTYVQNGNVVEVIGNIYENPELLEG